MAFRIPVAALISALILAACAFEPVYGPSGAGAALAGRIAIAEPRSTLDYTMARELERSFGAATGPEFLLDYRLSIGAEEAAITSGQEVDRVNLIGTLSYTLRTEATGDTVTNGTADGFVSYSSAGEPVAVNAARRDAEERLARILADRTRLFVLTSAEIASVSPGSG